MNTSFSDNPHFNVNPLGDASLTPVSGLEMR